MKSRMVKAPNIPYLIGEVLFSGTFLGVLYLTKCMPNDVIETFFYVCLGMFATDFCWWLTALIKDWRIENNDGFRIDA